jgi:hypothetical protein
MRDSMNPNLPVFSRFCPMETLQEMLPPAGPMPYAAMELVANISVPSLEDIPLREVVRIKQKDRTRSLASFADRLWTRSRGDSLDFAKAYADELWKVAQQLNPSVGEITVNVLGNAPIGLPLNPLGIAGAVKMLHGRRRLNADAPWFFILSDLRGKSGRTGGEP